MVVFFGLEYAGDYYESTDKAKKAAEAIFTATAKELKKDLRQLENAAEAELLATASVFQMEVIDFLDAERMNALILPRMKIYPFITSVNFGDMDGNGYLILNAAGSLKNRIKKGHERDSVLWTMLDENGKILSRERKKDDYDPRKRLWYKNALDKDGIVWSEPYIFRTTRDIGITGSLRLHEAKKSVGVIGVDIMLKDLSTSLAGFLGAYPGFTAHLVTEKGQIIACSDIKLFLSCLENEEGELPKFSDCGFPYLQAAMEAKREGDATFSFSFDGERFVSAQQRIEFSPQMPLTLFLTAPESALRGDFMKGAATRLVFFLVLLAFVVVWYVGRYLAPLRRLARSMKKIGKGNFDGLDIDVSRNDEVGDLVSEFKKMSRALAVQQEEIQKSERKYRALSQEFSAVLDAIPDNITLQSRDLKIIWANKGAAAHLGFTPEELTGRHCHALWHNRNEPCESCPVVRSFSAGKEDHEVVKTPEGKLWDLRTIPIYDEHGKVHSVLEVGRDITERLRTEEQLRQAQKMEAVGQLTGGVAHDFNNILSAIVGYGHLLKSRLRTEKEHEEMDEILKAADRAARLTQSLLAFSRKQVMDMKSVNLNTIILDMQRLLLRLLGEQVAVSLELSEEKLMINADAGQIGQVLMNLATNAKDAMPQGGRFKIETGTADLDYERAGKDQLESPGRHAVIIVSDTGSGMSSETRKKIYEPFFTTKEVGLGSGLGLAMVYGIIKQHEGIIKCSSEPGKGTSFRIYLPLAGQMTEDSPARQDKPQEELLHGTETILIAEDDPALRRLAGAVLSQYGYTVIEARDGQDAVRFFADNRHTISLVVLDVKMPNMNGKEALEEIRKLNPDIRAFFISGYTADLINKNGPSEKGIELIRKPIYPKELLGKVREVLDR